MTSRNMNVRLACLVVGTCALVTSVVACGDDSADTSDSGATTQDAPATTTTTEAATTTALPTTTITLPVVFTLRNTGLGPFDFGADPATVMGALTEQFGAAATDVGTDYPDPTGGGYYMNADQSVDFLLQFGRLVCWTFGLCVNFGGVDSATTSFLGWRYEYDTASTLSTSAGLTIGSRLSDHPELVEPLHPCYAGMDGRYAVYDGESWSGTPTMTVTYRSEGIPFTEITGAVDSSPGELPPADVTFVKRLRAGENPNRFDNYCGDLVAA